MAVSADKKVVKPETADRPPRIAIVAGGGKIPILLADHLAAQGHDPFIFMLRDDASMELARFDHQFINTTMIGDIVATMRAKSMNKIVLIGSIHRRPKLTDFRLNLTTLRLIARAIVALAKGDDQLLRQAIEYLVESGIDVVGAHELMPSLIAPEGYIAGKKLSKDLVSSMNLGVDAAKRLGDLDAGQGCVVLKQRIVALEGAEGTDQMLKRISELRASGRLPDKRGGILVKMCKPQQDRRVDIPTIGILTVKNAIEANLQAIVIEAGSSYLVDAAEMADFAEQNNLTIYGIPSTAAAQINE